SPSGGGEPSATAAHTRTGPAQAPRPTSSTPAITPAPAAARSRSRSQVGGGVVADAVAIRPRVAGIRAPARYRAAGFRGSPILGRDSGLRRADRRPAAALAGVAGPHVRFQASLRPLG